MDIKRIIEDIDALEFEVQHNTNAYMLDADCTYVIDSQLNGLARILQTYCATHNLIEFSKNICALLPIERNAIEFLCFWDGIKTDILEHSNSIIGQNKLRLITAISNTLQETMTKTTIDTYLSSFGIAISDPHEIVKSKRVYVESLLRDIDSIVIMNIAKDLNLYSPDVIETQITDIVDIDFVKQQIDKCREKMNTEDYDGAITNARTLLEEVLLWIESKIEGCRQAYDGNLPALYKRVSKLLNMYPDDSKANNSFNEIVRGFISIVNGFSGLSNNIGDRHATTKHPEPHHAKISVNASMIICEFLLDSYKYQEERNKL